MPKERVAKKSRTHKDVQKQGESIWYDIVPLMICE